MERPEAERARRLEALIARKREDLAERRAAVMPTARETQFVAAAGLAAAFAAWLTGLPGETLGGLERGHPVFLGVALGLLAAGYLKLRAGRRDAKDERRPDGAALMLCLTVALLGVSLAGTILGPLTLPP